MLTAFSTAVSNDQIQQENVSSNSIQGLQIEQGQLEKQSILDRLLGNALDFTGVQNTYSPGEEIDVDVTAKTIETYDTADATKVVNLYRCADSDCEDPAPIDSPSEDSCDAEEWSPNYDDCIARNTDEVSFSVTQDEGTSWEWGTTFNGLDTESTYILQAYIYTINDNGAWSRVTDVSEEKFTVSSSTSDNTDDTTTTTPDPSISAVGTPSVSVDKDTGDVTGEVTLENNGGDMSDNYIVEMQVRDNYGNLLSAVTRQGTCDPDHPENVKRGFQLNSGEQETITLNSQVQPTGDDYQIRFVTATGCMANGGDGSFVEPYGGGNHYEVTKQIGYDDPNIVQYREPQVTTSGDQVTGTVYFENKGGSMTQRDIVELQVKTPDDNFLASFVESRSDTCDKDHPENEHKEYRIDAGDRKEISITTTVPESGVYDIVLLTADQCGLGGDNNVGFVEPLKGYRDEYRVSNLQVGDTSTTIPGGGNTDSGLPVVLIALLAGVLVTGGGLALWRM